MTSYKHMTQFGLDVSHWQGEVDYAKFKESGGDFVIVKHAGANIGRMYKASGRARHREGARAAGLRVGYYYVVNGHLDALEQAKFFVDSLKNIIKPGEFVCLDDESLDKGISFTPEQSMIWLDYVAKELNLTPFYYSYPSLIRSKPGLKKVAKKYPLWLAAFNRNNGTTKGGFERHLAFWNRPSIWQYSSRGRITAYRGNIDVNVGDPQDLEKYSKQAPKPEPKPEPHPKYVAFMKRIKENVKNARERRKHYVEEARKIRELFNVSTPEPKPIPKPEPKPEPIVETEPEESGFDYPFPEPLPRISSKYGYRTHPISGRRKKHNGTDFAAKSGTPILAMADGVVVKSKKSGHPTGGYGQFIQIDHGDGVHSLYAHMLTGSRRVQKGDRVVKGEVIGQVGSTGYSTGPHLHFEVRVNGKFVNPMEFIIGRKK